MRQEKMSIASMSATLGGHYLGKQERLDSFFLGNYTQYPAIKERVVAMAVLWLTKPGFYGQGSSISWYLAIRYVT